MCAININRDPTCLERLDDDEPYLFERFTRWYRVPLPEFEGRLGEVWVTKYPMTMVLILPRVINAILE